MKFSLLLDSGDVDLPQIQVISYISDGYYDVEGETFNMYFVENNEVKYKYKIS